MATVRAPKPSYIDAIDLLSIATMEWSGNNVVFKNRAGTTVGTLTVRNDPTNYSKSIARVGSFDYESRDVLIKEFCVPLQQPARILPGTAAAGIGESSVSWSPDGRYLAFCNTGSPGLYIYKRDNDTFTALSLPSGAGANPNGYVVAFSPDGQYLAQSMLSSPYLQLYKRSGDTFTKLADPLALPSGPQNEMIWSPDGQYLVMANRSTAPYLTVYKRSGDVLTKLVAPTPPGPVNSLAYSPGGKQLAVGHDVSPYTTIYQQKVDTFTVVEQMNALIGVRAWAVDFSPNGQYLAVSAWGNNPGIYVYKRTGASLTLLPNLTSSNDPFIISVDWSPDSKYLIASGNGSGGNSITIYRRDGDTFTKLTNMSFVPTSAVYDTKFSPDGRYVAFAQQDSPALSIYKSVMGPLNGVPIRIDTPIP